jgi:hypothetical protein
MENQKQTPKKLGDELNLMTFGSSGWINQH